eukprot:278957_1
MKVKLPRLDQLIGEYYASFNVQNYFDFNSNGRIMQYVIGEIQSNSPTLYLLKRDLNSLFNDSHSLFDITRDPYFMSIVEFDSTNFPIENDISFAKSTKKDIILFVLKYCAMYNSIPDNEVIKQYVEYCNYDCRVPFPNKSSKKCNCGNLLTKVSDSSLLYRNKGAYCDQCGGKSKKNYPFWHCDQEENVFHGFGYDVCAECIVNAKCDNDCNKLLTVHMNDIDDKHSKLKLTHDLCFKGIEKCIHLKDVIILMGKYDVNMDTRTAVDITNHYLHLLHLHNNDEDFLYIYNKMNACKINQCSRFARNNQDRSDFFCANINHKQELEQLLMLGFDKASALAALEISNNNIESAIEYLVDPNYIIHSVITNKYSQIYANPCEQILDKMHCYFMHSFDTGNRLTIEQTETVKTDMLSKNNVAEESVEKLLIHPKILATTKMVRCNRIKSEELIINMKFNRIFGKQNSINDRYLNNNKIYNYGINFNYHYPGEKSAVDLFLNPHSAKHQYRSLKEELISNPISILTIEQFNNAYIKATIHFNSWYCKKTFTPFIKPKHKRFSNIIMVFRLHYVLALMVYCNFTSLSFE